MKNQQTEIEWYKSKLTEFACLNSLRKWATKNIAEMLI